MRNRAQTISFIAIVAVMILLMVISGVGEDSSNPTGSGSRLGFSNEKFKPMVIDTPQVVIETDSL